MAEDKNNATSDSIRPTTSRERGKELLEFDRFKNQRPVVPGSARFFHGHLLGCPPNQKTKLVSYLHRRTAFYALGI